MNEKTDREWNDIRALYAKFNMPIGIEPKLLEPGRAAERVEFLQEELTEFVTAILTGNIFLAADALVDLCVVAKGTAMEMGLPWTELWDDVHRANLAKERGIGKRGHTIDLIKPTGWVPPQTVKILDQHIPKCVLCGRHQSYVVMVRANEMTTNLRCVDKEACMEHVERKAQR